MQATRVVIHHEQATWWCDSPDVPGWTAAAQTRDDLLTLVAEASEFAGFYPYVLCEGVVPSSVQIGCSVARAA